jgi:uncharacterized protein YbjT (DUF2867 family)
VGERRAWVLGGSGAVGRFLLPRLLAAGWQVSTASRRPRPAWANALSALDWRIADLHSMHADGLGAADAVFGVGPLDLLCDLLERSPARRGAGVLALSSTSIESKRESPDAKERETAQSLARSEARLVAMARSQDWRLVLLRPTLIYGAGLDASLSPLREKARRRGWLLLPRACRGWRAPVHADDLAAALVAAVNRPELAGACLTLPGGERLRFDEMVSRTLLTLSPSPRLFRLPFVPVGLLARLLAQAPPAWARSAAPLARSLLDLAPPSDDWQRLGLVPRGFRPSALDFDTGE